ncbi:MAG: threonine synthase [SAR324 cluster bacterium]|nr:threonine synthase [SAR324 cluster bacterium]
MKYISTRGRSTPLPFRETLLTGLAPDGGLFLPERYPDASPLLEEWQALSFSELFQQVVGLYVDGDIPEDDLRDLVRRSYENFGHPEITPLVRVGGQWMLELFHGPTLAFKDVALQFLGNAFEYVLAQSGRRLTVAGATSGDTGSAAIHALRGKAGVEVFMLFPKGRVSPMQERQMTTVPDANIHAVAVEGSFDDAQAIIKGLFNDRAFNDRFSLGAVNSINWGRVMAQVVYYFYAYFRLAAEGAIRLGATVRFSVPTGNFGNIFAGYAAKRMGLPVEKLILATNANDILHHFIGSGIYRKGEVAETFSPSMDIQVASNFERYLFELSGRNSAQLMQWMDALRDEGGFQVNAELLQRVQAEFASVRADDQETLSTIREVYEREGYLLDPHTAVGLRGAMAQQEGGSPVISMATAHPAKFAEAIKQAIGEEPALPPALAGLEALPERLTVLPARLEAVRAFIGETLGEIPVKAPG